MTKKEKIATTIFTIINIIVVLISIYLIIETYITKNDPYDRLSSHYASAIISFLPILYLLIFKKDSNPFIVGLSTIYIFLAVFLGASLNFYNLYGNIHYDKLIHVFMGYCSALIGLFILIKSKSIISLKTPITILFIFSFALMIAGIWEMLEFSKDMITGSEVQGKRLLTISGIEVIDVGETIFDMIANLTGAIIFSLQYLFHQKTKKCYLMKFYLHYLK